MERINLKDIKKGQTFIEEDWGQTIRLVALENASEAREGYELTARVEGSDENSAPVKLYEHRKAGCYALRLYAVET